MAVPQHLIEKAIDTAPLNRGLKGSDWTAHPGNIAITFDDGDIALFDDEQEHTYQIHLLFASRGRKAIEHVREATRRMFEEHGASLIFGLVPDFRRDVKLLGRWAGYRSVGLRDTIDGPCELFVLSKFQWKVAKR